MSIKILGRRSHSKASEEYVDVRFTYDSMVWELAVPIVYRRTGLELDTDAEISDYLNRIYKEIAPSNWEAWRKEQDNFWAGTKSDVTKPIFDVLSRDFKWIPYKQMGENSNTARRLQDLKEMGYTIATRNRGRVYEFMLIPTQRGHKTGYEYWSGQLRASIVKWLGDYDAFESKVTNAKYLLPDHKFPEIRWNRDTRRESLKDLTQAEVQRDFQLLNNQRNQQKREVCRSCFQTNRRGHPFGIKFYYAGGEIWPTGVPKTGKDAEQGCIGCGWYDLEAWRQAVQGLLSKD
jgi:hypothetical protein